jgi:uncharacterized membrane protein
VQRGGKLIVTSQSVIDPHMAEAAPEAAPARSFYTPIGLDALVAGLLLMVGVIVLLWYSPSSYQIYLALHVLAIVAWVGGDITLTTLGIVFEAKKDGAALGELGKMGGWIGTRVYTPALFFAFAFGAALIAKAGYHWSQFWIVFGVVGWSLAATIGITFIGPELGRIGQAAATQGPDSAEVARRVKRLFTIFRFDTALLALIVVDMTAKPTF